MLLSHRHALLTSPSTAPRCSVATRATRQSWRVALRANAPASLVSERAQPAGCGAAGQACSCSTPAEPTLSPAASLHSPALVACPNVGCKKLAVDNENCGTVRCCEGGVLACLAPWPWHPAASCLLSPDRGRRAVCPLLQCGNKCTGGQQCVNSNCECTDGEPYSLARSTVRRANERCKAFAISTRTLIHPFLCRQGRVRWHLPGPQWR